MVNVAAPTPPRATSPIVLLVALVALAISFKALYAFTGLLTLPALTLFGSMALGAGLARRPLGRALDWPAEVPLAVGMILLGAQFEADTFRQIGLGGVAHLVVHWAIVGLLFFLLARTGRLTGRTAGVLATGLSGCGLSAVFSVSRADPAAPTSARALAIASTLAAGAIGFAVMPPISRALGLSAPELARWAGLSLPTTAEAVLVGAARCPETLRLAGAWRFLVNALQWLPIVAYLAIFGRSDTGPARGSIARVRRVLGQVPSFVWGLSAFGALGVVGAFQPGERAALSHVTNWAFLSALVGVGLRTRPASFLALGWRPIAWSVVAWAVASALLLGTIRAGVVGGVVVPG